MVCVGRFSEADDVFFVQVGIGSITNQLTPVAIYSCCLAMVSCGDVRLDVNVAFFVSERSLRI
jgi:hypothetical protein